MPGQNISYWVFMTFLSDDVPEAGSHVAVIVLLDFTKKAFGWYEENVRTFPVVCSMKAAAGTNGS